MKEDRRTALLVLGAPCSGASALAGGLSYFGLAEPRDIRSAQADRGKEASELGDIAHLNAEILKSVGVDWRRPGPFLLERLSARNSRATIMEIVSRRYGRKAIETLRLSFGDERSVVLKDSQLSLLLPLWLGACEAAGLQSRTVLIYRNPISVAASLRARDQIGFRQALLLWLHYNLESLKLALSGSLDAIVAYEELLGNPVYELRGILEQTGLDSPELAEKEFAGVTSFFSRPDNSTAGANAIFQNPRAAQAVKDAWRLLRGWNALLHKDRLEIVSRLEQDYEEAVLLAGAPVMVSDEKLRVLEEPTSSTGNVVAHQRGVRAGISASTAERRTLVLHYHLFKNAGTSIDTILRRNFGQQWAEAEFAESGGNRSNVAKVAAYLRTRPELVAFSSHTALLPAPELDGVSVFPIIFIRHPIDRLQSAYAFERVQRADTSGAQLAKTQDFAGYLRALLNLPRNRQARNFQTRRLSLNESQGSGSDLQRALRALDALPFVGLVEAYEKSVERLVSLLRPSFPNFNAFRVHENIMRSQNSSLEERLADIEKELGREFFAEVCAANSDDLEIHRVIKDRCQ